jgi:hypothetical protein
LQTNTVGPKSTYSVVPGPNAVEYEGIYRRYTSLFPRVARPPAMD